jgi:hypothetical protein
MGGINVGGVQIDPYKTAKEHGGHVVGQIAGDKKRKEAEALADKAAKAYDAYRNPVGALNNKKGGGADPTTDIVAAPTTPLVNEQLKAKTRADQAAQIEILQAQARGEGPSAAQDQLQLATDQNMRASLAMAASSRGNPALAMQGADRQRAIIGQQQAAQSGALRAQEMQGAQAQLAQAIQSQRQQDIGGEASIDVARERIASAEAISGRQMDMSKADPASDPLGMGLDWGQLASIGVTAAMVYIQMGSDERLKIDIEEITDGDIDEFFDSVIPKSFKYKHPEDPHQSEGTKIGLMAQDVKETKLGKILFSDREDGMSILDPQVLMGIMMAGMKKIMEGQKHVNT